METLEIIENIDNQREIFLAKELTKKYQQTFKGKIREILLDLKKGVIRGEWVVVIEGSNKSTHENVLTQ